MRYIDLSKDQNALQANLNFYPEEGFVEIITVNEDPGDLNLIIENILNTGAVRIYIGLPNCQDDYILQLVEGLGERMEFSVFTVPDGVRNILQGRGMTGIDFTLSGSLFRACQEAHRLLLSKMVVETDPEEEEYVHYSENDDTDRKVQQGEYQEGESADMPV